MTADTVLQVNDLNLKYGGLAALAGTTFDVERGSITALVGPNGAGKTTAFNVISGFAKADSGQVLLEGRDILGQSPHHIVHQGLVRTFQLTKTLGGMTVAENMMLAGSNQPSENLLNAIFTPRRSRRRESEIAAQAADLMDLFKLSHVADNYAAAISGGQRKLLELARALMVDPSVILLDEPMAGVNPSLGEEIFDYIEKLRTNRGITCLFVEHDMGVVVRRSDRLIVMAQGAVIADGDPRVVIKDPAVLDAYLGMDEDE